MTTQPTSLRIATRKSPLALWQAEYVKMALLALHPHLEIEIMGLMTEGDKQLASSLAKIGGKGLFVKELETALLERRADIAVHSMKDMPTEQNHTLTLAAISQREDARDVFVSKNFNEFSELPIGAKVGTSSSRRACLLHSLRPDLVIENLRGNVGTRLRKLEEGQYDAIILAAAGLKRLGEEKHIRSYLDPNLWIPAVGQGALGIECHKDDPELIALLAPLNDGPTRTAVVAERAFNQRLQGGCQLPIGAYATCQDQNLTIRGFVGHPETGQKIVGEFAGVTQHPEEAGIILADDLLRRGAQEILKNQLQHQNLS